MYICICPSELYIAKPTSQTPSEPTPISFACQERTFFPPRETPLQDVQDVRTLAVACLRMISLEIVFPIGSYDL